MRYLVLTLLSVCSYLITSAQFVARMEAKEPIEGVCNLKNIIVPFPNFKGQDAAIMPVSKQEIEARLNTELKFLIENPAYNDNGMIGLIVNCKGELVQCKMDNKTKSAELDKQIEAIFNSLGKWKAGKLNGKPVDTSNLFSFTITDGKLKLN